MTRLVLVLLGLSACVVAATDATAAQPTTAVAGPQAFLAAAAVGGMAEVELGQLAEDKASNDAVKAFGAQMVTDHGKANRDLQALAQQEKVELPTKLDAKNTALRDRLAKLSGSAFDRAYMSAMVEDHEQDVAEFSAVAKSSTDPGVKDFAARTLPVLEGHLKMAKGVQSSL